MLAKALNVCLIGWLITGCVAVAHADQSGQDAVQTFSGEIMDDLCSKTKSHEQMMEQMKSMTRDPVVCTRKCVQLGAHYVLYDRQKGVVYKFENPEKAEPFAGKVVRLSGTLKKNKIKIDTIAASK